MELFTYKIVTNLSKIWVWDPRSGKKTIPDPGVKKAPDPGPQHCLNTTEKLGLLHLYLSHTSFLAFCLRHRKKQIFVLSMKCGGLFPPFIYCCLSWASKTSSDFLRSFLAPSPFDSSGMFKYQAVSSRPVLTLSKPGMFYLLLSNSKQLPVLFINQKTEIHRLYFLF
jgi:hypothetical protein